MGSWAILAATGIGATLLCSFSANAQTADFDRLMAMGENELRGELQMRYDAGLAASLDNGYISADDPRYLWALETKVQCGIALGFLKSSTRDEVSISKCLLGYQMMTYVPAPPKAPPPPPPLPQRPEACNDEIVGMVFFDFDSAAITNEAGQTLATTQSNIRQCGWKSLSVVGHTDQAGSNAYNIGLSEERANAVAEALRARGVTIPVLTEAMGESRPRVPLPDGTRSPQNRRVEISAD